MADRKKILIVGGVAGGASAATRLRRLSEDAEIVMFERGEHISFANCGLPYHIGGTIADRERLLVQTPEAMHKRYRIDIRTRTEVVRIDREKRQVVARDLQAGKEYTESYDALILSPGAAPVRPPIPGIDSRGIFTLRNVADMDAINAAIEQHKPRRAVVVGGGYIGLEMTEALRQRGIDVTLVELAEQVFIAADPEIVEPVHQELRRQGVDLRLGTSVQGFAEQGEGLSVSLSSGEQVQADMVILSIGVRPETKLAADAGLEIGKTRAIVVDEHMRTCDQAIYAVGDAVQVRNFVSGIESVIPLAGPANRQARIAADNIFGRPSVYRDTQGTAICKVFDLAVGMTGMSEKALQRADMPYEKVHIHPASHAGYYPGAHQISLKLLFDPTTGKVLGGQAVGADGVDKRIDVLAVAIRAGLSVHDLAEQELSYAPPYGSAKDPVNYAGFVAANVVDGDVKICHVADVLSATPDQAILDVRTPAEMQTGAIPGSINIPLDDLRERLAELPKDKELLVSCQVGLRGYLACRILDQHGYTCRNLSGGYKTYMAVTGMMGGDEPPAGREVTSDTGEAPLVGEKGGGAMPAESEKSLDVVRRIDASGLQCPGPIMQLKGAVDAIEPGQAVQVLAGDPGFERDVAAWCNSTGHRLVDLGRSNGHISAIVQKNGVQAAADRLPATGTATQVEAGISKKNKTMVVFSGELDKALASFIIANGAAAMGSKVTMFFTFWGLNVLRRPEKVGVAKNLVERMFGWMMPRGADRLKLSKMHMGGAGAAMIKGIMRKKNVQSLPELIEAAKKSGVRLVACAMSMDLMGIKREELIDGVEEGGVAMYLDSAESGTVNLFI